MASLLIVGGGLFFVNVKQENVEQENVKGRDKGLF